MKMEIDDKSAIWSKNEYSQEHDYIAFVEDVAHIYRPVESYEAERIAKSVWEFWRKNKETKVRIHYQYNIKSLWWESINA